jgi:hypothetical protein
MKREEGANSAPSFFARKILGRVERARSSHSVRRRLDAVVAEVDFGLAAMMRDVSISSAGALGTLFEVSHRCGEHMRAVAGARGFCYPLALTEPNFRWR